MEEITILKFEIDDGNSKQTVAQLTGAIIAMKDEVKKTSTNIKDLEKVNKDLEKQLKSGKITEDEAKKATEQNNQKIKELKVTQASLKDGIVDLNRKRKEEINISNIQKGSLNELRNSISQLTKERNNLNRSTFEGSRSYDELTKKINTQNQALKKAEQQVGDHRRSVGNYGIAIKNASQEIKMFGSNLLSLDNIMKATVIGAILKGLALLKNAIGSVIDNNIKFQENLQSLSAITGLTGSDLEYFGKVAIETSKEVRSSASEILAAFELVGSKRPELLQDAQALTEVTKAALILSEATGGKLSLEDAANSVTASLNQLNLSSDQSLRVINALAAGSKFGAANITLISNALDVFGSIAGNANITLEQSIALIEILAEKNIVGAEAGTKLRNVILTLQQDQENYTDGVFDLNLALSNLSTIASDSILLLDKFDKQNVVAATIIANNAEQFNSLTKAVTDTNIALEQQAIQNNTVSGTWDKLINRINSYFTSTKNAEGFIFVLKFIESAVIGIERAFTVLGSVVAAVFTSISIGVLQAQLVIEQLLGLIGQSSESFQNEIADQIIRYEGRLKEITSVGFAALTGTIKKNLSDTAVLFKESNDNILDEIDKFIDSSKNKFDKANEDQLNKLIENYNNQIVERKKLNAELEKLQLGEDQRIEKELEKITEQIEKESEIAKKKFDDDLELLYEEQAIKDEIRIEEIEAEKKKNEELVKLREEFVQRTLSELSKLSTSIFSLDASSLKKEEKQIQDSYKRRQFRLENDFNQGLITQEEFTKKSIELDRNRELQLYEIELAKYKSDKNAALINVAINTASAVSKSIAESPLTFGLPWSAFAVLQGGIQAATIASQPEPTRPVFAEGGDVKSLLIGGKSHALGGTKFYDETGKLAFEAEKGEGMFITKKSATVEALSHINQKYGGRSFNEAGKYLAEGGSVSQNNNIANTEQIINKIVASVLNNIKFTVSVEDIINGLTEYNGVINQGIIK